MATHVIQDQNLNVHNNGAPKSNVSKPQKKGSIACRKALKDISNTGKPSALQVSRKSEAKKLSVAEENLPVEGFVHNHEECINAQWKSRALNMEAQRKSVALDLEYFRKRVGLDNDKSVHSASPSVLPVSINSNLDTLNFWEILKIEFSDNSPICGIPWSPEPDMHLKMDMDDDVSEFFSIKPPDFRLRDDIHSLG